MAAVCRLLRSSQELSRGDGCCYFDEFRSLARVGHVTRGSVSFELLTILLCFILFCEITVWW